MTITQCLKYDYSAKQVKDAFEIIKDNFQTMQEKYFPIGRTYITPPKIDEGDLKMMNCYMTTCVYLTNQDSIIDNLYDETSEEFNLSNKLMDMATKNITVFLSKFDNSNVKGF